MCGRVGFVLLELGGDEEAGIVSCLGCLGGGEASKDGRGEGDGGWVRARRAISWATLLDKKSGGSGRAFSRRLFWGMMLEAFDVRYSGGRNMSGSGKEMSGVGRDFVRGDGGGGGSGRSCSSSMVIEGAQTEQCS